MDPQRIGPWRLLSRLGAGGMGVVYRARHEETGELAAVKTMRAARGDLARALAREVDALSRLDHPGVARFLGDGAQDGTPWYAMGLVEGVSLEALDFGGAASGDPSTQLGVHAADDLTAPVPSEAPVAGTPRAAASDLERLGRVYGRLAAVLAWVHGEGVVHGDLKPANVLVGPGDLPVLVDFGLAGAFVGQDNREALDPGAAGGTVAYLSPEQIRRGAVDARADLYALGVMLFRALTGRPPFVGPASTVLSDHLSRTPPRPRDLVPDVPADLDRLVMALLAKEPRDRPAHAGVVVEVLSAHASDVVPAGWPTPRPYLYRPGLIGREEAMRWVDGQLEDGRVALIGGAPGLGKTRLLVEVARRGAERDVTVLTGRAVPATESGAGALHPLRGPLEQLAERHAADPGPVFGDRGPLLAPFAPGVPAIGEPDPALDPGAARARLVGAVAETLRAAARRGPLLLLLDDLHDADALTVDVIATLAAQERTEPLVVLGTWRSDVDSGAAAPLLGRAEVDRIELQPLDGAALGALVADLLGQPSSGPLGEFLQAHADGNPLFVAEYLRAALDRGVLARDDAGRWRLADAARPDELGVPTSIEGLLDRRLGTLGPDLRATAELASVLGREVDPRLLGRIVGSRPARSALAALVDRRILAEAAEGYRFVHPLLRDKLNAAIDAERRRALHREVLRALPRDDDALGARAWHHEQAGERAEAAEAWLSAGQHALSRYDVAGAEAMLRAALRVAEGETELNVRFFLGYHVLLAQGRFDEAIVVTTRELELARALGDEAAETRAMRSVGACEYERDRWTAALPWYEAALQLDRARGRLRGVAFDTVNLANALQRLGRAAEALPLVDEGLSAARAERMPAVRAHLLGTRAMCRHDLGELKAAESDYRQAVATARETGQLSLAGASLGNLGNLYRQQDRIGEARAAFEEGLDVLRRVGAAQREALVLPNHAILMRNVGEPLAAAELLRRAGDLCGSLGNAGGKAWAEAGLAEMLLDIGRLDAFQELSLRFDASARPTASAWMAVSRARAARLAGRPDEAARLRGEAAGLASALAPGEARLPWLEELLRAGAEDSGEVARILAASPASARDYWRRRLADVNVNITKSGS